MIPKEIIDKIEVYYWEQKNEPERYGSTYYLTKDATFGYTLAQKEIEEKDKEMEEIRNAAIKQSNIATDRLYERDAEIERLKEKLAGYEVNKTSVTSGNL